MNTLPSLKYFQEAFKDKPALLFRFGLFIFLRRLSLLIRKGFYFICVSSPASLC